MQTDNAADRLRARAAESGNEFQGSVLQARVKRLDKIEAMLEAGKTISDIAREESVSRQAMHEYVRRHGLTPRACGTVNRDASRNPVLVNRVRSLRQDGLTIRDIARASGVSTGTVSNILRKARDNG